ncbi:ABC transporter permease [Nocardioidaceae bacterium SCSIO 66511]|nr:ABC transporter permease [Nocardioidaceae bacterium SCSIO 66511]
MATIERSETSSSGSRPVRRQATKGTFARIERPLISVGAVLAVLLLWWAVTALDLVKPLFMPEPGAVWDAFIRTLTDGYRGHSLLQHLSISLQRVLIGFAIAVVIAVPLGVLAGVSRRLDAVLDPLITFYRVLPPLAYFSLLLIVLGIGEASKVTLLLLAAFPPVFLAVVQGVRSVAKGRIDAARSLGANRRQVMRYVILPSILPELFVGMRVSLGITYTTLVAAEMIAAQMGIGWMVFDAKRYLQTDVVYLGIIIMGITGVVLDGIAKYAQRRIVPWQGKV